MNETRALNKDFEKINQFLIKPIITYFILSVNKKHVPSGHVLIQNVRYNCIYELYIMVKNGQTVILRGLYKIPNI